LIFIPNILLRINNMDNKYIWVLYEIEDEERFKVVSSHSNKETGICAVERYITEIVTKCWEEEISGTEEYINDEINKTVKEALKDLEATSDKIYWPVYMGTVGIYLVKTKFN